MNSKRLLRPLPALLAIGFLATSCSSSGTGTAAPGATVEPTTESAAEEPITEGTDTSDGNHDEGESDERDAAEAGSSSASLAIDLFLDGALVGEPVLGDCVLNDGSAAECYTITVAGTPTNHDVGPFCPTTVTADAEDGGLWLDGEGSYEIDGSFFTELAGIYGDDLWDNIYNEDGSVNVIDNADDFQVAARPDITEEFYYHCVDGNVEWLDGGEQPTHTIVVPATSVLSDTPTVQFATGAHSNLGVTLNGALVSGSADMTAILASYTIAAFDDCGGHINPALGYHVHGTAGCSDVGEAPEGETSPFAYALDGFTIHAPYEDGAAVELDECNGHTSDEYGYHYHANSIEQNATLICLMGQIAEGQDGGGGRPAGGGGGQGPPPESENG